MKSYSRIVKIPKSFASTYYDILGLTGVKNEDVSTQPRSNPFKVFINIFFNVMWIMGGNT